MEIQRRENRCLLRIMNADPDDEAEYSCECGKAKTSCKLSVTEPEWAFMKQLEDVEGMEREKAIFECDVNDPEAEVHWYKADGKEVVPGGKYEIQKDGFKRRLIVKNCHMRDDGKYTCKVLDKETSACLFVEPDIKFFKKLENKREKEKGTLVLECKAANPHNQPVKWLKDGKPINKDDPRVEVVRKGETHKLVISNLKREDAGLYACQVGERSTKSDVIVDELPKPPKVDPKDIPEEIIIKRGETIALDIPYIGVPVPTAQWKKDGTALSEADTDIQMTPDRAQLRIPAAERGDSGEYELTLSNEVGTEVIPVAVRVLDRPGKPEGPLDVVDVYSDRCSLLWDRPKDDGGSPIKHYVVEKKDSEANNWQEECTTEDLEIDVTGLQEGHRYTFQVKAVNDQGVSDPLPADGEIIAKDPWDPSDPPSEPEVIDYDKDYAELSWQPPARDGGAPIEKYIIEKREKPNTNWEKGVEVPAAENTGTVDGLKEGKEYEFRIMAKNRAGNSEPSIVTPPILAKSRRVKPKILNKNDIKPVRVKVGNPFTIPVEFLGEPNPKATWKRKTLRIFNLADGIKIDNSTPKKSSLTYSNPARKDTGEYTVTVTNKHGDDSADIEVVVLGPPSRPEGPLKVSNVKQDQMTLNWKEPTDTGGTPIDGYNIEKMDTKKGRWEPVKEGVRGTKYTVPKLQEGHDYQFRVVASGPNGDSEALETDKPTTARKPYDEPFPPSQPQCKERDRDHITITWQPPEKDGGAPVEGYNVERKEPKSNRWTKINKDLVPGCEFTDSKVTDGKEYQYRVTANNEAGESEPSLPSSAIVAKPSKEAPKVNLDALFGAKEIRADCTNTEDEAKLHIPKSERGDTGKYTITVTNESGTQSADIPVVVLDKPGAPGGPLEVSDVMAESCKLSWKEPEDNGGAEVTGYVVEKCEEGSDFWDKVPGVVMGTSHPVKGLKEGKKYKFRVKAENIYGAGEPLVTDKPTLAKNPFDTPDAPRDVTIPKYDKNSAEIHWKEPNSDGGNPIKGYIVEKKPKSGEWVPCNNFPVKDTNFTVMGLKEGQVLEFRVKAVNDGGEGKPSKATEPHKVRDQVFPAGAPNQPNVDKITKDSVGLSWQKPTNDGGGKLKGYIIEKKKKDGDWEEAKEVPATENSCTIPNLKEGDEYQFRVKAVNAAGPGEPSRPTKAVVVEEQPAKPVLNMSGVKDVTVKAGQNFQISIPYTGFPKPTATWINGDEEIKDSPRVALKVLDDQIVLANSKAERGDSGKYKVTLKNDSGQESGTLNVNVLDKPAAPEGPLTATDIIGEELTLNWKAPKDDGGEKINNYIVEKRKAGSKQWQKVSSFINSPSCNVRNLEPGTEYEFRVMAENMQGVSEPLETSTPILAKLPYWANISDVLGNEYTVKGLTEGKEYEFRVAAINNAGVGDYSQCSEAIKARPAPVAPKVNRDFFPKDITVKKGEEFKIAIPYTGNPIPSTKWEQGTKPVDEGGRIKFENTPTELKLINKKAELGDAGRYTLTMENEKGKDTCSINVKVVDAPASPEGPLEVSNVTPDSCVLNWKAPKEDGGSPVSNYVVEKKDARTGKWEPVSKFVRGTNFEVMGLEEGHEYMFRVSAENEHGVSEPLETALGTVAQHPYTAPGAPSNPHVVDVDEGSVTLSWNKPKDDGGKKIQGYVVEYKDPTSGRWKPHSDIPVNDTVATVDGLKKDKEYEFRVRAKNMAGLGEPSGVVGPVTPKPKYTKASPPGTPEVADIGKTFVDLKWDKPKNDGGAKITGYVVEKRPKGADNWVKATDYPCIDPNYTVTGLPEGSEWEFRVTAVNAAGNSEPSLATAPIKIKEKIVGSAPEFIKKPFNMTAALGGEVHFVAQVHGKPLPDVQWYRHGVPVGSGAPPKIEKEIKDQQVQVGEVLKLKIPVSGTGPFEVKVKKDNRDLPESDRFKVTPFDDYVVLNLKDCTLDDTGNYKVEISNPSGTADVNFKTKIVSAPSKPTGPLNVGDITKSGCKLSWKPPRETGGAKIQNYIIERQEVGKPYWVTVSSHCKDCNQDVQGLAEDHQYKFRVSAVNEHGQSEPLEAESPITAKMPFDKPDAPGIPSVTEVGGDFVSLQWDKPRSDGGGRITGYWIDKREHGTDNWNRVNLQPCITNMINIPNLVEDKQYEFRVFAENEAGLSKPSMASNSVKVKDPNAAVIPEFSVGMKKMTVEQGKNARFECEVTGTPKPEVQWYKGTRELFDDRKFEILEEGDKHILIIHDVFGEDQDEYSVKAFNRGGSRVSRAELIIKSPPKIHLPNRFKEVSTFEKGEPVVIKIPFTGNPKPSVKWLREGEEIKGRNFNMEVTDRHAILTIKEATKENDGPYHLHLENEMGSDSATITIQINDRPSPPRFPLVENIREDSVVLSWKPPLHDGGSFITGYEIEKCEPPIENWVRVTTTSRMTFHNITGLSSGKEYKFRIIAENFYGKSEPCEPTSIVQTEDADAKKKKQLEEELGSGAFGVVHRCVEKATGRVFVAKFINTPYPLDKATVKNEINVMNNLHHPKLLQLHDAFEDRNEMILVLEFLAGGELFDRIAADDYKMTEAEVINYMRQVCEGLKHMHEHSIVHLDVKPENVMCTTKKSTDVKMIDFGLATKLNPDEVVKVTTATAEFAAPEIVDNEPIGFYTDMWAVGVLAYVLLSGLSPFAGEDDLETLQNVGRCDWEFAEEAFSDVSPEAKDFIKKLLIRKPHDRMTVHDCLDHSWLKGDVSARTTRIPSSRYDKIRQKIKQRYADWPQPMPAIGRIANFSSLRKHRPKEFNILDAWFDRKEAAPKIIRKPRNTMVVEGNTAKFDCKVIAASAPIITWIFDGVQLTQSVKHMQRYSGNEYELKISRCKMEDKGDYHIKAENSFGKKEEKASLKVEPSPIPKVSASREPTPLRRSRQPSLEPVPEPPKEERPDFNFGLRPRLIQAGTDFKLLCIVQSTPTPKVTWTKDGKDLSRNDHYMLSYSSGVCTMEVQNARVEDTGRYTCSAINDLGEEETHTNVVVEDRVHTGLDKKLSLGTVPRLTRHTSLEPSYNRRASHADYSSSYKDSSYSTSSRYGKSGRYIDNYSYDDSYTSRSSRRQKKTENNDDPPVFSTELKPQRLTEGDRLKLTCTVKGRPDPDVEWFCNGQLLKNDEVTHIKNRAGRCSLEIDEVLSDDDGTYVCKAINSAGSSSSKTSVQIRRKTPVKEKIMAKQPDGPRFITHPAGVILKDGDSTVIECRISGDPGVQWYKGTTLLTDSEDFRHERSGDTYKLVIAEVFPEDGAIYKCVATNSSGSISSCFTIFVDVPDEDPIGPVFDSFPLSRSVDEGAPFKTSCKLDSADRVIWSKDGREIQDTGRFRFGQDGNLFTFEIPAALATDSGHYNATAQNSNGTSQWAFTLHVPVSSSPCADIDVVQLIRSMQVQA
ncbi:hypothetical protein FSP39_016894 [Pinctada imbricata]|uniref:Titin n=1 Tax=Pinctada imbricata TaxID=66713 RepID=A0AA88YDK3_PINIB|nr:hypothetical protein FSP39_016894 [Pinctada imbricata]